MQMPTSEGKDEGMAEVGAGGAGGFGGGDRKRRRRQRGGEQSGDLWQVVMEQRLNNRR